MIKINKNYIRTTLLAIFILVSIVINVSAVAVGEWNAVCNINYTGVADSAVTQGISDANYAFSAEIKDEALLMKSDSLVYYRVQTPGIDDLNSAVNSHGISLKIYRNTWVCTKIEDSGDGVVYAGANTNAILVEEQGGINAMGTVRIKRTNGNIDRNNIMFNVDTSLFESTDNDFSMKIKYFTPDGLDKLQLTYPTKTGEAESINVYSAGNSGTVNTWQTKTVELTNADFTKGVHADYTFRLTGVGMGAVYIHSVELCKNKTAEIDETAKNTVFQQKISEAPIFGNAKLTYDLTFPLDSLCAPSCAEGDNCIEAENNTGKNMMSVNFANSDKIDFASIIYDIDGSNANIYALSTDENKDTQKNLLYQGEIVGKTLTYTVTLNMKNNTYTVEIAESGEALTLETQEDFTVINRERFGTYCHAQYVNFRHNQSSEGLLSVIDNISVYSQIDLDYEAAVTDAEAIYIDNIIKDDFTLPVKGSVNGSKITWSSNSGAIIIDGKYASVTREESDIAVTLTATVNYKGMETIKDFYLTLKSLAGTYMMVADCSGEIISDGTITARASLIHPGTTGAKSITFAVFSVDSVTGKICNTEHITKNVTNIYGVMNFDPITAMNAKGGDTVKCYLWDEKNRSIVNNKPIVRDFKAESKVKGVGLSWNGYDDNNAVEYYAIYKNGVKLTEVLPSGSEMKYLDTTAVGRQNSYSIVAVDTNSNNSEKIADDGKYGKIAMTYYLNPNGEDEAEINSKGNGITMLVKASGAGYTEKASDGRLIPSGKYIPLKRADALPKNNVAIDFTYKAVAGTTLQFLYNNNLGNAEVAGPFYTVTNDNNNKWQVFTVRLTDANLETVPGKMNGVHFALQALGGDIILKKIEMIELSKYE